MVAELREVLRKDFICLDVPLTNGWTLLSGYEVRQSKKESIFTGKLILLHHYLTIYLLRSCFLISPILRQFICSLWFYVFSPFLLQIVSIRGLLLSSSSVYVAVCSCPVCCCHRLCSCCCLFCLCKRK